MFKVVTKMLEYKGTWGKGAQMLRLVHSKEVARDKGGQVCLGNGGQGCLATQMLRSATRT